MYNKITIILNNRFDIRVKINLKLWGYCYMKRLLILICIVVIASQFLIGCSSKKRVPFNELYSEVIGFVENNEKYKPVPQDTILLMTTEDVQKFYDKYFTLRKFPMEPLSKEKSVLYIQIPSPASSVDIYCVHSVDVKGNILTVSLEKTGPAQVDAAEDLSWIWKWVMFIEVDKTNLKDNMKIVIKK
jgi:hypothetical protein